MKAIKGKIDSFCMRFPTKLQTVLVVGGVGAFLVGVFAAPLILPPAGQAAASLGGLLEASGAVVAMTAMMVGIHGATVRGQVEWIAWQKRDLDQWAKELVNDEPHVAQLQKTVDLRRMQIANRTAKQELDDTHLDLLEDRWSTAELEAVQHALNQQNGGELE